MHSGITFECNQWKRAFTEKGRLRTHSRFVHYMIQLLTSCDKCPFKGKLKEIFKDIFSGYMKARGLNVDGVIKGLLRNW